MIPYYNPHFGFLDLIRTMFCLGTEAKLAEEFRDLTGKKYILFTSSCRSALYLAYKAIGRNGVVHTSPLTCKVALLPILATDNEICFNDVRQNDWTLDPNAVKDRITKDSIAIQAIHFGGFPCDMQALRGIADENRLVLIEDCAQGYGSSYDGVSTGKLGDISCFTLTKNLFSLGGGVFATDNKEWYLRAKELQQSFASESTAKIAYRVFMALITTYRAKPGLENLYQFVKRKVKASEAGDYLMLLEKELTKPAKLYLKSCWSRWSTIQALVEIRKEAAKSLLNEVGVSNELKQSNPLSDSSYTKLFVMSGKDSKESILELNEHGIEAMHLEHKHQVRYQGKLLSFADPNLPYCNLKAYECIHDRLLSLPVVQTAYSKSKHTQLFNAMRMNNE
ncbi:MAG: DegT/DnrJ/EryC1/StrS family aminotransferase [Candidatus Cloacimonetes bacterium]|nr:DegT/DnrJ/EryC1/StrS family aminotransferase [Candidatus Cloacimonadota bacterium]